MKSRFITMCAVGALVATSALSTVGIADAKDTIRVRLAEYSTKTGPYFKGLAAKYNTMQDTVEVQVEHLPWPEMQQQLVTDISAGTAPDISHMATRWMAGFAKDGALAPIEGLMSDSFTQSFVPTFLDLQKQDGHTWGLPIAASARGLFINKELFAKAGIAEAPKTWDETLAAAKKSARLTTRFTALVFRAMISTPKDTGFIRCGPMVATLLAKTEKAALRARRLLQQPKTIFASSRKASPNPA
jgi:multiple sugar transport system substrate-binding protein